MLVRLKYALFMNLENVFEPSFQAVQFEEIVALVEKSAADIEVRRHSDERWLATIWIEKYPGSTWPRALFSASGATAAEALLLAHEKARDS